MSNDLLSLVFATASALLFVAYVVLGHRLSRQGASEGVSQLGAAMAMTFVFISPIDFRMQSLCL